MRKFLVLLTAPLLPAGMVVVVAAAAAATAGAGVLSRWLGLRCWPMTMAVTAPTSFFGVAAVVDISIAGQLLVRAHNSHELNLFKKKLLLCFEMERAETNNLVAGYTFKSRLFFFLLLLHSKFLVEIHEYASQLYCNA